MDKLLDKEVHQLYKASPHDCDISNYFGSSSSAMKSAAELGTDGFAGDSFGDGLNDGDQGFVAEDSNGHKTKSRREHDGCSDQQGKVPGALV